MFNGNNICIFEGRTTQNQNYSQINGQNGPIDKVLFSISVPRALTSQQRQDPNAKKNDFVNFSMIGAQVKTLQQYFPAGTPIKVFARYTEYETVDQQSGQKKYGHIFEVENIGFVVSPAQNQGQNNNNGGNYQNNGNNNYQNNNNNYQNNNQNYQQNNNNGFQQQNSQPNNNFQNNNQQQNNGNFQMFGDTEFPF